MDPYNFERYENMRASLVCYSQPIEEFFEKTGIQSIKELIAYCARISNPTNQLNKDTSEKLIDYLLKHKHFSPFEMCSITVEIETTRDIARQLLRHRSFTFQEFSQRYADPTQMEFVIREARMQDPKNRQKSVPLDPCNLDHVSIQSRFIDRQKALIEHAKQVYQWALDNGIAKEQARCVLPEGCTPSRLYVQGTIRSFIHYIDVRTDEGTQQEHRELAVAIAQAIQEIFDIESTGVVHG
jgi:thymidylate synthase (FAD)